MSWKDEVDRGAKMFDFRLMAKVGEKYRLLEESWTWNECPYGHIFISFDLFCYFRVSSESTSTLLEPHDTVLQMLQQPLHVFKLGYDILQDWGQVGSEGCIQALDGLQQCRHLREDVVHLRNQLKQHKCSQQLEMLTIIIAFSNNKIIEVNM